VWLFSHEIRKVLQTTRIWIILLFSIIPAVIFLDLVTSAANDFREFTSILTFKNSILGVFLLYLFFYDILVSIIVVSDSLSGEKAYSLLFLNTSRLWVLAAKIIAGYSLLVLVANVFVCSSLVVVGLTWSISFTFEDLIIALLTASAIAITPYTFTVLNHCIVLHFNLPRPMASYAVIFFFFVVPFIVYYITLQLLIYNPEFLSISLLPRVQEVVNYLYSSVNRPSLVAIQDNLVAMTIIFPSLFLIGATAFFFTMDKAQ
jgi:hypothetical protein